MTKIIRVLLVFMVFAMLTATAYATGGEDMPGIGTDGADDDPAILEKTGEQFSLRVPFQLSNGILLTPHDGSDAIKMIRLGASPVGAVGVVDEDIAANYPAQKFVVLPFESDGCALLEVIEGVDSPGVFQYRIDLGDGRHISSDDSGGYSVLATTGTGVVSISRPWAFDVTGQSVPVNYTLDNNVLTMSVEHQGGEYTYPIVADPCFPPWKSDCWDQISEAMGDASQSQSTHGAAAVTSLIAGIAVGVSTANPATGVLSASASYTAVVAGISVVVGLHCAITCDPSSEPSPTREPF